MCAEMCLNFHLLVFVLLIYICAFLGVCWLMCVRMHIICLCE